LPERLAVFDVFRVVSPMSGRGGRITGGRERSERPSGSE